MLPSAFISYAHEDGALASWITVELEAMGVKVFRDQERLRVGDLLPSTLEKAVANADVFVLIGTPDGLSSEWTRREFLWAVYSQRRICPIYPHGVPEFSGWPELPDLLAIDAKASLAGDSGRRRTGFRGEGEQRSGLIPNTIPGERRTGFRPEAEHFSVDPGMVFALARNDFHR